ncbi:MAG: hypothetical protein ABJA74_03995 [Lapillicoccus sp.]
MLRWAVAAGVVALGLSGCGAAPGGATPTVPISPTSTPTPSSLTTSLTTPGPTGTSPLPTGIYVVVDSVNKAG